jgi:hypothetical protein
MDSGRSRSYIESSVIHSRREMTKRRLTAAAALLVLAASVGSATAAPTPGYTVTCTLGGETAATWNHGRIDSVFWNWGIATAGPAPNVPHPPHGFAESPTPAGATSVTMSFHRVDGTTDQVTQPCS